MNKLLISLISLVLLAGCGEAEKNDASSTQQERQQAQSQPADSENNATPAPKTESQENATSTEQSKAQANTGSTTQQQNRAEMNNTAQAPTEAEKAPAFGSAVIDATNEQTLTESLDRMIVNLTEAQKEAFSEAFLIYAMSQVDVSLSEEENQKKMLSALNGKSVQNILDEAAKLRALAGENPPPSQSPSTEQPSTEQSTTEQSTTEQPSAEQQEAQPKNAQESMPEPMGNSVA